MRAAAIGLAIALALAPGAAFAQAGPPAGPPGGPSGPPPGASGAPPPGAISRDQYIQRAERAAGRRFDRIDVNHLGYITRDQERAFSAQRRHGGPGGPGGEPQE
jgi:hypothetical protein